ncbi:MAG: GDYXXLXY domain-containing protein [Rubrivivax sp.]|nr:GDYXXLXY domain-containing protein [Rubrivivax sp.]
MSQARVQAVLQAAVAEGLLPTHAQLPAQDDRPWPVVLLTALGAWLAAVPLLVVVGMLFGGFRASTGGYYLVGVLLLAAAVVVLRSRGLPLFVEQLAVPALLVGGGALGAALMRDVQTQPGAAALAGLAAVLAALLPRPWLRSLLGATAAVLLVVACLPARWSAGQALPLWLAWHLALVFWLAALWTLHVVPARWACRLEPFAAGWLAATLAGLAGWAGMSLLVGASLGGGPVGEVARQVGAPEPTPSAWLSLVSALLALVAAFLAARQCPSLRKPWIAAVALVLTLLAWFMPTLGAVCLALALSATSARWLLAAGAGLAAAWIVGAFYYQLQWPLAHKALGLLLAGAVLGALAWRAHRQPHAERMVGAPGEAARAGGAARRLAILASGLLVLTVANLGIWQKESLIAHGQPVFVALAPVDPRSLMQGDYMQLNFRLPATAMIAGLARAQRPRAVMRRDAQGVATPVRLDDGTPLAADELRIELTPKDGRWILVTDAWFFAEGEASRWAAARFGEFRVDADGRALLVNLRGADLKAL